MLQASISSYCKAETPRMSCTPNHHGLKVQTSRENLDQGSEAGASTLHQVRAGGVKKKGSRRKRRRLVPPHNRTSRFRGVYWEPKGSKWYSSISSNHKVQPSFGGHFPAARAIYTALNHIPCSKWLISGFKNITFCTITLCMRRRKAYYHCCLSIGN